MVCDAPTFFGWFRFASILFRYFAKHNGSKEKTLLDLALTGHIKASSSNKRLSGN